MTGSFSGLAADGGSEGVRLEEPGLCSEGSYQFSFEAKNAKNYPIEASTDLVHWALLTNILGGEARVWVIDPAATNMPQRFFRACVPLSLTNMVFIPPGTFTMGSPEAEEGRKSDEGPQTVVTISNGFWIGQYEVNLEEYSAVMGTFDSHFTFDLLLPVNGPNWSMATNYCHKLTERERVAGRLPDGYIYRLPTEAEWEYACRAGTTTPFGVGDGVNLSSMQANFDGNFPYGDAEMGPYLNLISRTGRYPANAWGLFDMHGNVWEWCQDWYGALPGGEVTDPKGPASGSEHVLRGGGYTSLAKGCRSAERDGRWAEYQNAINGFRVVLAPDR